MTLEVDYNKIYSMLLHLLNRGHNESALIQNLEKRRARLIKQMRFFNTSFARNIESNDLIENFLVAAVFTVLVIRAYLKLYQLQFGYYPIIGGRELHIAHMLWGGLLMLIGIIILLSFLNRSSRAFASIITGIGFGIFIDQIGKFVTRDNNYFFQPSVAIIYVIFILVFLYARAIERYDPISSREYIVNALELIKDVVLKELSDAEKKNALHYLHKTNQKDPLVVALRGILIETQPIEPSRPNRFILIKQLLGRYYKQLTTTSWFPTLLIVFFILQAAISLSHVGVVTLFAWSSIDTRLNIAQEQLNFTETGELFASALSSLLIFAGIVKLRLSRLAAYHYFKRAVLVGIFLTQFFAFYETQFYALSGLFVNLLILIALNYIISQENQLRHEQEA